MTINQLPEGSNFFATIFTEKSKEEISQMYESEGWKAVSYTHLDVYKRQIKYRTTSEQLKHEKYLYLTNSNPYNKKERLGLLVERVESLISKENSLWSTKMTEDTNEPTKS